MIDLSILNDLAEIITYGSALIYGGSIVLFGLILYKISKG